MARFLAVLILSLSSVVFSANCSAWCRDCGFIWPMRGKATFGFLRHNHEWRTFQIYVPKNYHPNAALILDFHGQASSRSAEMMLSCWKDLADQEGAVVVYPQALSFPSTWDAGDFCCYPEVMMTRGLRCSWCSASVIRISPA